MFLVVSMQLKRLSEEVPTAAQGVRHSRKRTNITDGILSRPHCALTDAYIGNIAESHSNQLVS